MSMIFRTFSAKPPIKGSKIEGNEIKQTPLINDYQIIAIKAHRNR